MTPGPSRTRRALGASAFAALALALVLLLRTAVASVRTASDAVLEAEASSAAALVSVADAAGARALFGDRLEMDSRIEAGLDRPVVRGERARAALYDADGWDVMGTLTLTRRPRRRWAFRPGSASSRSWPPLGWPTRPRS